MSLMGKINTAIGGLGGLGGLMGGGGRSGSEETLIFSDIAPLADVTCGANSWVEILSKLVPAQQVIELGAGEPSQPHNQGFLYMKLETTTPDTYMVGKVRVGVKSADGWQRHMSREFDLSQLAGDINDRNKMIPLPRTGLSAKEDSYIIVELKHTAQQVLDYDSTDSVVLLPVTVYR